jgi:hypothetical protein
MGDQILYYIKGLFLVALIAVGLWISSLIGANSIVLYIAIGLFAIYGVVEVVSVLQTTIRGSSYAVDLRTVFSVVAAGYIVMNYLL